MGFKYAQVEHDYYGPAASVPVTAPNLYRDELDVPAYTQPIPVTVVNAYTTDDYYNGILLSDAPHPARAN